MKLRCGITIEVDDTFLFGGNQLQRVIEVFPNHILINNSRDQSYTCTRDQMNKWIARKRYTQFKKKIKNIDGYSIF